ncbi:hypothetical protein EGW08_016739, partial [Elysia chlorotica]
MLRLLLCNIDLASLFCMLLLLGDCLDLQVSSESTDINVCPSGWTASFRSRSCLKKFHDFQTWKDAKKKCKVEHDAGLIKPDEHKRQLLDDQSFPGDIRFWTALNDIDKEGTFVYAD